MVDFSLLWQGLRTRMPTDGKSAAPNLHPHPSPCPVQLHVPHPANPPYRHESPRTLHTTWKCRPYPSRASIWSTGPQARTPYCGLKLCAPLCQMDVLLQCFTLVLLAHSIYDILQIARFASTCHTVFPTGLHHRTSVIHQCTYRSQAGCAARTANPSSTLQAQIVRRTPWDSPVPSRVGGCWFATVFIGMALRIGLGFLRRDHANSQLILHSNVQDVYN